MPIKGLTNRQLAFPEIGSIRKGAAKEEGKNMPGRDLTYFRVEFDEREVEAAAKFKAAYAEKPTEINIVLPFNDIPAMWDAWYEAYVAGRMIARSDGEFFTYLVDHKTGEQLVKNGQPITPHRDIVGEYTTQRGKVEKIQMKPTGRLKVIIPELQRLAYLTVHTTSIYDIANISSQLEAIAHINGGRIAGVPLVLRRRPKKISTPTATGRARLTKWMLSIEADPEYVKAKLVEIKHLALPGNGLALLPEPEDEGEPEIEDDAPAGWDDDDESIEGEYDDAPDMADAAKAMGGQEVPADVLAAMERTTSKGTRYDDLKDSQLEFIIGSDKAGDESKSAAKLLLDWRIKNGEHK